MPPPPRRELRELVRKLGAASRSEEQKMALQSICSLCFDGEEDKRGDADSMAAIAAAGAIPPLVQLLRQDSPALVKQYATNVLMGIAARAARETLAAFTAAGAFAPLVQMLRPGSLSLTQYYAAAALSYLCSNREGEKTTENAVAMVSAGAIPLLVQLLGPGSPALVQGMAAMTLVAFAGNPANAATIAACGAMVQTMGPASYPNVVVRMGAAAALMDLAAIKANAVAITAAGAIPLLVQLLGPGVLTFGQQAAAGTLGVSGSGNGGDYGD
ncbi:hypothetical protein FOA52_012502 [Chlamydomonas sp. UWO 241]|nr:hypothetical protein FOA52_012502 [Chlamydomonas sp. UWO 241]